ncbi:putative bifunctional diguanylate cyclase/phosphodiesterase [Pannonibacter tanglangensis]|uniref:EAL domain-containing protein n=1 Tax=Pannonibacter tanglangensis TaxID=2750084 RepID=A0ABW9ZF62_9HYPH|nr:bifunctional diguanylate cyclase/phosphodiesterase [Pannonibacter sp. XCT-34]NBN63356.1 EAL domain-containing protein [Pannonibacter sp. XCT-34]
MTPLSRRRNLATVGAILVLIALLAASVFASNRLMTRWLLVHSLESAISGWSQVAVSLHGRTLAGAAQDNAPRISTEGLRLTTLTDTFELKPAEEAAKPVLGDTPAYIQRLADQARRELGSDAVHAASAVVFPSATGWSLEQAQRLTAGLPERFFAAQVTADEVTRFLALLHDSSAPQATLFRTWWGGVEPLALIGTPMRREGQLYGASLMLVDIGQVIGSVNRVLMIVTALIVALCIFSLSISAFVLWVRFRDVVRTNRNIEFLAHHDPLTGLPNRAVFSAKLNEALRLAHAKASNLAVILIDVDKFKAINDTYGHGTGDIFLQVIADRLRSVFGEHLVARLSGDEFAVMVTSHSDVARMTKMASDMIAATKAPCVIDGIEIQISLSMGLARANDGSWRSSRLLHCADLALYRAKHSGRSTFVWYTSEMDAEAQKRKEIEAGLVKALKFDQFELVYQPQFSLHDNRLKGYEALIRWEHPTKGTISPDVFISVAEDTGLIEDIGDWVLRRACQEAATWEDKSLRVAVNFSPAQFRAGETQKKVAKAIAESGLDPRRLEIEITESLLIADTDAVVETLEDIHALGVTIAMDDFGTGYSSLSYLSRFPFDKIKIDRSFIRTLGRDIGTDAIVTSIIGLGRSLNVQITAEGVESQEQVTLLRAAGCDLVQGYLFGRPGAVRQGISTMSAAEAPLSRPHPDAADQTAAVADDDVREWTLDASGPDGKAASGGTNDALLQPLPAMPEDAMAARAAAQ